MVVVVGLGQALLAMSSYRVPGRGDTPPGDGRTVAGTEGEGAMV